MPEKSESLNLSASLSHVSLTVATEAHCFLQAAGSKICAFYTGWEKVFWEQIYPFPSPCKLNGLSVWMS